MLAGLGTGVAMGLGLALSWLLAFYHWAAARAHKQAGVQFAQRAFALEVKLDQMQKALTDAQTPYIINFSEEQVLKLASRIVDAVHTLEVDKNATKH